MSDKIKELLDLTRELLEVAKDELGYIDQKIVWRDNPLFSIDSKFQKDLGSVDIW